MRKKIKEYRGDITDETKMDAKVFLFLRGSCLKVNLQDTLKLTSSIDAEDILTDLVGDGFVKRIQDPDKKAQKHRHDIFSMIRLDGELLAFVQGIFRYWITNIRGKKRIQRRLHPNEKALFERHNWTWGEESIKRWANYLEKLSEEILTIKPKVESDHVYSVTTILKVYSEVESAVKKSQ